MNETTESAALDWKVEFRERMLRSAQQFAREMAAADANTEFSDTITVEQTGDGVTVHFWQTPTVDDETNG